MVFLILFIYLFSPTIFIFLTGSCYSQAIFRNIFSDCRTCCCISSVCNFNWCNKVSITANKYTVTNLTSVFNLTVIVDSNCTTTKVYTLTYIRITNLSQVAYLCAVIYVRIFDFHKITNSHMLTYNRIRSDISKRSNSCKALNLTIHKNA